MEKQFIAYEYKQVTVSKERRNLFTDLIGSFGWEITKVDEGIFNNQVWLKRDYNVKNREILIAQEKDFFNDFERLEKINQTKKDKGTTWGVTSGIIGTGFMAGATFAYLSSMIWLTVGLAVPGFLLWGLAPVIYKKITDKKIKKVKEESEGLTSNLYVYAQHSFSALNEE